MVTGENYAEKYQLPSWNSQEYINKTFGRKILRLKFILANNPMAEKLTMNSQTSEILSLKNLPFLPEKSFCKESHKKYYIRNIQQKVREKKTSRIKLNLTSESLTAENV